MAAATKNKVEIYGLEYPGSRPVNRKADRSHAGAPQRSEGISTEDASADALAKNKKRGRDTIGHQAS